MKRWLVALLLVLFALSQPRLSEIPISRADPSNPKYGTGMDGSQTYSSSIVESPIDSPASGTAGSSTLSVSSGSFPPGRRILIHQTRGTGAGLWEINEVQSFAAGTINTVNPLIARYSTGGNDRAQVIVMPQYTNLTIDPGVTVTAKPWDGSTGGIFAFFATSTATISGTISVKGSPSNVGTNTTVAGASGGGYRGGYTLGGPQSGQAQSGEGTTGDPTVSTAANGNGGGGGAGPGGGGGLVVTGGAGGHAVPGVGGGCHQGACTGGQGGLAAGNSTLSLMVFGGGGGGGIRGCPCLVGSGASGGGIVLIIANTLTITGAITVDGGAAQGDDSSSGAGGAVLMRVGTANIGNMLVTAAGGGYGGFGAGSASPGADGRIRIEYCSSLTGSTTPPASVSQANCGALDTDGNGCPDARELGVSHSTGGQRDPNSPWDFFDVPLPVAADPTPNGAKNTTVSISDVIAIVFYIGTFDGDAGAPPNSNGVRYDSLKDGDWFNTNTGKFGPDGSIGPDDKVGRRYDRTPSADMSKPWQSGPPNGAVTIQDAIVALNQVGDSCN